MERLKKYGFDLGWFSVSRLSISDNLEDAAWIDWLEYRDALPAGKTPRPAPEKYS